MTRTMSHVHLTPIPHSFLDILAESMNSSLEGAGLARFIVQFEGFVHHARLGCDGLQLTFQQHGGLQQHLCSIATQH